MTDTALSALQSIDAGLDREIWVKIGTAAKIAGISEQDFISWCQTGSNYSNDSDCKAAWKSFKTDGKVTEGTLYYHASQAGWKRNNANTELRINVKPQEIWDKCVEATNAHPYISRKGGWATGLRIYHGDLQLLKKPMDGALVVPVLMGTRIATLQFILPDGGKFNLAKSQFEEGYYCIGKPVQKLYIVEGIGQAWAVNIATDECAVVAFGDSRINTVAEALRRKYPKSELIIVPDRGKETKAARVAKSVGGAYIALHEEFPENYDVNDYLQQHSVSDLSLLLSKPIETSGQRELQNCEIYQDCLVTHEQQAEMFKGYYFVRKGMVFLCPDGELAGPKEFDAEFSNFVFPLDSDNNKLTRSAYDAYMQGTVNRKETIRRMIFNPFQEQFEITRNRFGKCETINTYKKYTPIAIKGDVTLFLNHLEILFPDENDREIIISYMSALAQYPGKKFKWCPVVQGAEGSGKSALAEILEYIVGEKYTTTLDPEALKDKSTKWKDGHFLVLIHEMKDLDGKYMVWEKLKHYITEDKQKMRALYSDGVDIVAYFNFFIFTNWKDLLPKTDRERRLSCFQLPIQTVEDIEKNGLNADYFDRWYTWLRSEGGLEAVAHYLLHFDLDSVKRENNPMTMGRAPKTSTTDQAIEASLGLVEQEILEKIQEGLTDGFKGGFVNSNALKNLLVTLGRRSSLKLSTQRDILLQLGYKPHPELTSDPARLGRVHWDMDGKTKPTLFVKIGSEASKLTKDKVRAEYERHNREIIVINT